ncbi:MAG TPA: hypothetical protein VGD81_00770 [Opitutaceae bacterium]
MGLLFSLRRTPSASSSGNMSAERTSRHPIPGNGRCGPSSEPPVIERVEARRRRARLARWAGLLVVAALAVLLWMPRLSGPIDLRYDAGVYYVLGTSLATGQGYRILSEPGAPEGVQYPPLLPALVAVHQWALGTTDPAVVAPWLRLTYAAIFLAFLLSVFAFSLRLLSPGLSTLATVLCALSVQTYFLSDLLFAEIPFALVSVLFVLVADGRRTGRLSPAREAAAFALGTIAFLLRTAGIALLAAWTLEAFLQRRWRAGLTRGVLAVVPVLAWQAHIGRVRSSDEYLHPAYEYQRAAYQYYNVSYGENIRLVDPFQPELGRADAKTLAARVATNLTELFPALGEAVSLNYGLWKRAIAHYQYRLFGKRVIPEEAMWLPIFALAAAVVGGLLVLIRGEAWLLVLLTGTSLALVCLTPWPGQFARYLAPLAPFLSIAAVVAIARLSGALRAAAPRWQRWSLHSILAGFLAVTLVAQVYTVRQLFRIREREGATFVSSAEPKGPPLFYHNLTWRAWEQAVAWIGDHAPKDAIVATSSPHLCYLLIGRRSVLPPMEADPDEARRLLEAVPVSYLIVDELTFVDVSRRYGLPAVQSAPGRWRAVHSIGATTIYTHDSRSAN